LRAQEFAASIGLRDASLLQNKLFINDEWLDGTEGKTFEVHDPSTGELLCTAVEGGKEDAEKAVAAAHGAFADFKKTTARSRARMLRQLNDLLLENQEDIARLIVAENGKPWKEALAEVTYSASFLEWFSGEAERAYGATIPAANPASRIMTIKQPIGVVAALAPWNLPLAMAARKVAAAIAAGCTVVVKPAGETPYATAVFGVLAKRAGVPKGVVNVITALENTALIGETLCTDPRVRKVSFTGSTRIGKLLVKLTADTLKKLSLELGGNAPVIVFDDANVKKAVDGVIVSKLRNGGQTCVAANRLLVQKGILDAFLKELKTRMEGMAVGGGLDHNSAIGPLISTAALKKVDEHTQDALSKGATQYWQHPASPLTPERFAKGNFYPPTIVVGLTENMKVWEEETFGPLAAIKVFEKEEEVEKLANDTRVGLGAYLYTQDIGRALRVAEAIHAGMVGINTGMLSASESPFGGVGESGWGKEGSLMGIEDYVVTKAINIDISA